MFDLETIMNQAKDFQKKMKDDLQRLAVTGSAGGGSVKVVVNGQKEITNIELTDAAMEDRELLADMLLAAVHSAYADVDKEVRNMIPGGLGDMDLSGIMDMFKK